MPRGGGGHPSLDMVTPLHRAKGSNAPHTANYTQGGYRKRETSSSWSTDDSQGSDTDLEDEVDGGGASRLERPQMNQTLLLMTSQHNLYGQKARLGHAAPECLSRKVYGAACRRYGVQPSQQVLHSLTADHLDLENRNLSAKDAAALACMLLSNTCITELNLSGNRIEALGIRAICGMLDDNVYITHLNVSNNNLGSKGAAEVGSLIKTNEQLTTIRASGNIFTERDAGFFAEALQHNYRLKELDLSHNRLQEEGGATIGQALGGTDSLQKLDLSWNHLRLRGALALALGLQDNTSLTHINLAWNGFADAGARAMAEALKVNVNLLDLDLSSNRISSLGAESLADALTVNTTLQVIKLGLNPLSSVGAIKVLDAIRKNSQSAIIKLDLREVSVTLTFEALTEEIKSTRDVTVIHGVIVNSHDHLGSLMLNIDDVIASEPYHVFMVHVKHHKMLLWEQLTAQDTKLSYSVNRGQFIQALQASRIPLSVPQIEEALDRLDKEGTGIINYSDLLDVKRDLVLRARQKSLIIKLKLRSKVNLRTYQTSTQPISVKINTSLPASPALPQLLASS